MLPPSYNLFAGLDWIGVVYILSPYLKFLTFSTQHADHLYIVSGHLICSSTAQEQAKDLLHLRTTKLSVGHRRHSRRSRLQTATRLRECAPKVTGQRSLAWRASMVV